MMKILTLVGSLLILANSFSILDQHDSNLIMSHPSTPQKGNITQQEEDTIKKTIQNAQKVFSATQFNKIAQNVSLSLKSSLTSFRWSVFVYDKGIKQLAVSPSGLEKKKYISIIGSSKFNLSYEIYGTNSGYGCSEKGGGGTAEFGENVSVTNQQKIKAALNNSIIYRGDNIESAAQYITDKLSSIFNNPFTVIANPTTSFGFYICRNQEYWGSLRNYGDFKWNYYVLSV